MEDYAADQNSGQVGPIERLQINLNDKGEGLVNVPKAAKKKKSTEADYAKPDRWPNRQFRRQYIKMPKCVTLKIWSEKVTENQEKGIRFNNAFFQNQDTVQTDFKNRKEDSIRKNLIEFYKGDKAKVEAVMSENSRIDAIRYEKKLAGNQSNHVCLSKSKRKNITK